MGARDISGTDELDLNVGRWGNSLAVRLPAELARQLGLVEGSTLHLSRQRDNSFALSAVKARPAISREALLERMREHRRTFPACTSVINEMRADARY